jgi:hypothetical protein
MALNELRKEALAVRARIAKEVFDDDDAGGSLMQSIQRSSSSSSSSKKRGRTAAAAEVEIPTSDALRRSSRLTSKERVNLNVSVFRFVMVCVWIHTTHVRRNVCMCCCSIDCRF